MLFRSFTCSSHICLPTRLGSTPVTALRRYYAGSDSPPLLTPRRGIPASRKHTSGHSVANHLMQHCHGIPVPFLHLATSTCFFLFFDRLLLHMNMDFALRQQARRVHPAESRLFPTDCPFPFRCFPPRLTATQLRSSSNLKGRFGGNFHPSICLRPQIGRASCRERV